ncbi:MAG: TatD family hydrolase [Anaerolineae bacterium]|nr:TatD family hydrolase [Anaerolineae bacterium]
MVSIIDTHVHLQNQQYAKDLEPVLTRAAEAGVCAAIVPGTDLKSSRAAVALAEQYATGPCRLYAAVGFHPTDADGLTLPVFEELRDLAQHPRVVAMGEIGLDYYWPNQPKRNWPCASPQRQRQVFRQQLALAADLGLPVIVHDRDAHQDTLQQLRDWIYQHPERTGTLHAYAGGPELLPEALALGFYIGMDGPVTFSNATALHTVARDVPLDRLLLETDGPYLTPQPYRGKRNQPAYLIHVAQHIAELRHVTADIVAQATTHNAQQLFLMSRLSSSKFVCV